MFSTQWVSQDSTVQVWLGLADPARVTLLFQRADGLGGVGAGLALDVAAVGLAVVLDADGDVAVPVAVLAEVDG